MESLETFQSDTIERPIYRRRLFLALVVSLILHAGIIYWFRQTRLPEFNNAPVERLVPRIFSIKNITIDEKLLDGSEQQAQVPKPKSVEPAPKPIDLPDESPLAGVSEGKMVPPVPAAPKMGKPIASDKPVADASETQTIARVQDTAKLAMDQDLDSLRDSLLHDQPADVTD